ncbi:MAG: putative OhrR transcriptional regulator, MarR/EmrR family protein [Osedax symbiont Rs2]|nr:MAG: putative OhrR transcriptional regulator, MarR/EmrR family protein [Osedax symbiont Rs2]
MKHHQLKLDQQLCHRLYIASNGLTRAYRHLLEALNLTYPQYVVMMALWEEDGITVQVLLEKTAVNGGAMSLILKKMIDKKLLTVTPSEEDKRKKLIHLLPTGQQLQDQAAEVPTKIQCSFPNIEKADLHQLIGLLDKVCLDLADNSAVES